ncbi:photosystem I reaction center subunit XI [Iningainema tapete]|uniref:Photosystem I reaction center subunit XI n=1 Tax=Iningainema tapete BLCC-T55 TaxID=2748662 RepID=A0A8J6XF52_9CYAN|nr:photosystem I reaction center protein subunit XI [Iningainema tapete BLCC-T55]
MAQAVDASKNRSSDPRNQEVVFPEWRNPQRGNLETPINASGLTKWYINNLPAYRPGITTFRRGIEIGMAHGYWIFGPFAKLGPLRDTADANFAGLLATLGLIVILTGTLSLYANSNPNQPVATVTVPNPPDSFKSSEGWNNFASAFLIGGLGGAVVAYFIASNLGLILGVFGK